MRLDYLYSKEYCRNWLEYIALFTHFRLFLDNYETPWFWLATQYFGPDILAGFNFQGQENQLVSPDSFCAITTGRAGHETNNALNAHISN